MQGALFVSRIVKRNGYVTDNTCNTISRRRVPSGV